LIFGGFIGLVGRLRLDGSGFCSDALRGGFGGVIPAPFPAVGPVVCFPIGLGAGVPAWWELPAPCGLWDLREGLFFLA